MNFDITLLFLIILFFVYLIYFIIVNERALNELTNNYRKFTYKLPKNWVLREDPNQWDPSPSMVHWQLYCSKTKTKSISSSKALSLLRKFHSNKLEFNELLERWK